MIVRGVQLNARTAFLAFLLLCASFLLVRSFALPPNTHEVPVSAEVVEPTSVEETPTPESLPPASSPPVAAFSQANHGKPYDGTRFTGGDDLATYEKPPLRVVGFILAGRREFIQILDCYLQRNLVRNGGWLDEVLFFIRTDRQSDSDYLVALTDSVPEYTPIMTSRTDGSRAYSKIYGIAQPDTIYIKIDDDVVFFEDHAIPAIVKRLVENPQYSVVSANVMNQPALSWVHYHLNSALPFFPEVKPPADLPADENYNVDWRPSTLPPWKGPRKFSFNEMDPAPFKNHRWLPLPKNFDIEKTPMGILGEAASHEYRANSSGWHSWAIAAQEHYSFLTHLENHELYRYKFDLWPYHYDRISINFIAFRGEDIIKYGPVTGSDEHWMTIGFPKKSRKPAVLDGTAMAVHFGFHRQVYGHGGIKGWALNHTDLIHRYRGFANEFVCGRPVGTPMP